MEVVAVAVLVVVVVVAGDLFGCVLLPAVVVVAELIDLSLMELALRLGVDFRFFLLLFFPPPPHHPNQKQRMIGNQKGIEMRLDNFTHNHIDILIRT